MTERRLLGRQPTADPDGFYRLHGDDLLIGWIPGLAPVDEAVDAPPLRSPQRALEDAVLPAMRSGRCGVTFSGGRDSSVVLAVATDLARRTGLPDPVPFTRVFPDQPDAEEEDCQEAVVRHLNLADWVRVPVREEQDILGPVAARRLRRYGVLFPVGAHSGSVLYDVAAGYHLLTGEGGDEVFGPQRITTLRAAAYQRRPVRRTVPAAALCLAPKAVRKRAFLRELVGAYPWVRAEAARIALASTAAELATEPLSWQRAKLRLMRRSGVAAGLANLIRLAAEHDIVLQNPLLDPQLIGAIARLGGFWGSPGRNQLMAALFGHLLPPGVLARTTKASFNRIFVGEHSRAFAREWDGAGVDPARIDPEQLRVAWLADPAPAPALPLLQAAWLAAQGVSTRGTGSASAAA